MTTATAPGAGAAALAAPGQAPIQDDLDLTGPAANGLKPLKRKRSRWVTPLFVVAVLVIVAIALTLLTPDAGGNSDDLDPANPGFTGAQGLAQALSHHGVSVTVVRSQRELLDQTVDGNTTVVITNTRRLSGRTAEVAMGHAGPAASFVLVNPDAEVVNGLELPVTPHLTDLQGVAAACRVSLVGEGFRLAQASRAYELTENSSGDTPTAPGTNTCFPDKSHRGGAMVTLPAAELGQPDVILLGDDSLITNGKILDADNAAIALRLFGQTDHLIWYVPSLADIAAADGTSRSIAPVWFQPGLALAISAFVLLCLWRGRRLGRLVTEPLPVIVRAVETTESRGRMYRKSRDRARALAILQLATRRRLAAYLGLPATSAVSNVAAAAAAVSGRTYQDVLDLLSSVAAHDDSSLLVFANDLAALEKEVRRT